MEISSGGIHPTAGLEDAFISPGDAPDLVIANEGDAAPDGNVSLLVGGPGGLHLAETVTDASVPHPDACARCPPPASCTPPRPAWRPPSPSP